MKLSKENIQKAVLAAMVAIGGLYYYAVELMGPLSLKGKATAAAIVSLEGKIKEARTKIAQTRSIESSDIYADSAQKAYAVMNEKIPTGQPVAWLPTRMGEYFKRQGIPKQSFRMNPPLPDPGLPGYQISSWSIDFPAIAFGVFGKAVAGLENQEGLIQIMNLQLDTMSKDPEFPHAQITFSTFVKSEK